MLPVSILTWHESDMKTLTLATLTEIWDCLFCEVYIFIHLRSIRLQILGLPTLASLPAFMLDEKHHLLP